MDAGEARGFSPPPNSPQFDRTDTGQTVDSFTTNATAPNLPGPGRNVGLLFDWLGSHVESLINKWALHFDIGPKAVANEIRHVRRHHQTTISERESHLVTKIPRVEAKAVKNLCKKLLKYTRFPFLYDITTR